jgi:hypothetical protein
MMFLFLSRQFWLREYWGRILGRNLDKSLKGFPPCYSQTPLQFCFGISISWNSRNLLHIYTDRLLYTVKDQGGKPDRKTYPLPYGLRNQHRNLKSENSQDYAQNPQRNCTFMNSASDPHHCLYHQKLRSICTRIGVVYSTPGGATKRRFRKPVCLCK